MENDTPVWLLEQWKQERERAAQRQRNWRAANRDKMRTYGRKSMRKFYMETRYKLTEEEYNQLLTLQSNKCAICKSDNPKRKSNWNIDHDHITGKVRGLLCHRCNIALGNVEENIETLRAMIVYLEKHQ